MLRRVGGELLGDGRVDLAAMLQHEGVGVVGGQAGHVERAGDDRTRRHGDDQVSIPRLVDAKGRRGPDRAVILHRSLRHHAVIHVVRQLLLLRGHVEF